jgi:hypothetical protein
MIILDADIANNVGVMLHCLVIGVVLAAFYMNFLTPRFEKRLYTICGSVLIYSTAKVMEYFIIAPFLGDAIATIALWFIFGGVSCILFKLKPGMQAFLFCSIFSINGISTLIMRVGGSFLPGIWEYSAMEYEVGKVPLNIVSAIGLVWTQIAYFFVFILSIRFLMKSFTYKKRDFSVSETLSLTLPCVPGIIMSLAEMMMVSNSTPAQWRTLYESYSGFIMVACVSLLLLMLVSVRMNQKTAQLNMEAKDAAILREQVKQLHNMDSGGVYTEIRGMRHDMKNHLSNMRLLMKQNAVENTDSATELNEYMDRMGDTLEKLDFAFKTGNSVSDVVIHQAFVKAKHDGIKFTSEFFYPSSLDVNAYDLAVILQNALENACEACMTVPEEKRFIDIRSRKKGETFFVEISNSYAGKVSLDSQTGLPPTSKTDGGAHGLGLVNIQRTAKKHQGDISIQLAEKDEIPVFKLTVALQGEPERKD